MAHRCKSGSTAISTHLDQAVRAANPRIVGTYLILCHRVPVFCHVEGADALSLATRFFFFVAAEPFLMVSCQAEELSLIHAVRAAGPTTCGRHRDPHLPGLNTVVEYSALGAVGSNGPNNYRFKEFHLLILYARMQYLSIKF